MQFTSLRIALCLGAFVFGLLVYDNMIPAAGANLSEEQLQAYELGAQAIPLPELEILSRVLNKTVFEFQDRHSPVGHWFTEQKTAQEFNDLRLNYRDLFASRSTGHTWSWPYD